MIVLGIETSCDETSAAVVRDGREVLSNVIYSQDIHIKFGGVVPELASREHIKKIQPIVTEALDVAGVKLTEVDAFTATFGPGLVGALLVGLSFAKSLAFALDKPFYGVNHLEGHIYANKLAHPDLDDEYLTLLVSGGHTMLVDVNGVDNFTVLGRTLDDAAGEAFDKVAKVLKLGYPGGAVIDRIAKEGNPRAIDFPRAIRQKDRLDFSFSGLKTAVALYVQKLSDEELGKQTVDIAASFQEAAVDALVDKSMLALKKSGRRTITISGGVAANSRLRSKMETACQKRNIRLAYPPLLLCTDNAAMIAGAAFVHLERGEVSPFEINAIPYQKLV
ncbi:MAG: tRNA (adenosine(37)-N6)-threonylcarbamoyltransferase complex transferase subunit TsaD [candidate division Zixibacteria bacterium]|nr:tRNA (adenosine(37)-N6)-threonylcarbamoyltransferase complex transferase subunit TsaD [candidate division Zixibacteria bacterium]